MKRSIFALLTAILLAGTAQAAITTNLVQDLEGNVPLHILRWSGDALYDPADPANNSELLDGFATNRWMIASSVITNIAASGSNAWGIRSSKDKPRGAIYTITADQFSGANPNAELSFDVRDIWNLGTLYAEVYGIVNPGTSGNSVIYNVLSATPLTATGSGSVSLLGSKTIGGLADNDVPEVVANHTISFSYNGTDDIAVCLYVIGTTANKQANIDNVVVTTDDAVSFPAAVTLDPSDELIMYVADAAGVETGTVDVAYVEGSPATNVTITSVSVVDQTHSGAFANATALPLTLTTPAPASEAVSIAFDNTTAGLTDGQTATGVVQIIWNEAGSASSSTSTVPVSATYLAVNDSNILAIFDHTGDNASPRLQGLTAKISYGNSTSTSQGSTDSTYGTLSGNARTDGGCYRASLTYPVVAVALTNETGYECTFDSLHFDAAKQWAKGLKKVAVSISGDVTSGSLFTNSVDLTQFSGTAGDYDDFDIDLTGLADRTLAHGEAALIEFTFFDGDPSNSNALSCIDNIALLGSGTEGAGLTRVPGGPVSLGVVSSDTTLSELIRMSYEEGDAATNVVITGVTVTNETHAGAFSYSGSFPQTLLVPGATNDIMSVEFDNTVANLAAGETASALMEIAWNEAGAASRTFSLSVSATRPADVPEPAVVALFDTDFQLPDAAIDGILGAFTGGAGVDSAIGSNDETYGSLASPAAPLDKPAFKVNSSEGQTTATLTVTNRTAGDVVLSSINFDVGRVWENSPEAFTLSVSGGLTEDADLLTVSGLTAIMSNVGDAEDFDVDLTGLADHVLSEGESVDFTFTFVQKPEFPWYGTYIDNVALMGDKIASWALSMGLELGVNDAPTDNPDGDGKDNLMEYATNGDPLTPDAAATLWQAEDGGTNWFYHVYSERTDDSSLTFTVDARDNLVFAPDWSSTNMQYVGESASVDGFKSVTNRTDMGSVEFIRLQVEQN